MCDHTLVWLEFKHSFIIQYEPPPPPNIEEILRHEVFNFIILSILST